MPSFINFNKQAKLTTNSYTKRQISEALYLTETKDSRKIVKLTSKLERTTGLMEALGLFSDKISAMRALDHAKTLYTGILYEGQFSWMTHDTGDQIGSEKENTIDIWMYDNKGNSWYEKKYDGYGEFGGMDYYTCLAQMNGYSDEDLEDAKVLKSIRAMGKAEMRDIGIALAFGKIKSKDKGGKVLFPALTTDSKYNWKRHDFKTEAESDPNQSWFQEEEEDDDDDWGDYDENLDLHTSLYEQAILENAVRDLHFETDPKKAEKMKIELGKSQGEVVIRTQIEGGNYSLKRFRKEIGYWNGKKEDLEFAEDVFVPGHYNAATSTLGDGPHAKKSKKVKWTQKKYDQWLEDVASNDGWKNASDMAQNAKNEPGLIDWVKKNNRGEDAMQRIQWDIEAFAESVVTESGPKCSNKKGHSYKEIDKDGTVECEYCGLRNSLSEGKLTESAVTEKFNFSKKEVEAAANLIASAISQADKVKAKVHDLEYDKGRGAGFEISIDGEKYDGGSYVVKDNGDVVNAAIGMSHPNAVYNTIGNKDIADVFINMEKYESNSVTEGTYDSKDHIGDTSDGQGSNAEIYKKGKGYYVVVSGEVDYDFTAKNDKELLQKLKDNEFDNTDILESMTEAKLTWDSLKESLGLNEGRSINKISKEHSAVVLDMKKTVDAWKVAEGDRKSELLETLRGLNARKAELEKELDQAVAGKDSGVELALSESEVNESLAFSIAGGIVLGVVGVIALVNGAKVAAGLAGIAIAKAGDAAEAKRAAKRAAARLKDKKAILDPIAKKFENDDKLKQMYVDLAPYMGTSNAKNRASAKVRTEQLGIIAKYIKSKLTPDENAYFTDLSKYLRTGAPETIEGGWHDDTNESVNEGKKYTVSDFKVGDRVIIARGGNKPGVVKKVTKAPNNLVYVSWNPKRPSDESQAFRAHELIPESVAGKDSGVELALSESEVNEKDDAGTHLDNLADLVGNAKSFMNVGKELKAGNYKYDFSTGMMPMYMIKADGFKFAILNKKYVDDGDRVVGDIAIGLMESLNEQSDDALILIQQAIAGMKNMKAKIKGDNIIISNKAKDEFVYSLNDGGDVKEFIATIEESININKKKVESLNEGLRNDLKKFIKKNSEELDRLADTEQWEQLYLFLYTEFEVEPDSEDAKDLKDAFDVTF